VPIRKSITPDYLICLEDGKKLKMLKRHLAGLGLTPAQYREKWKLPADYPMVAPNYAAQRPLPGPLLLSFLQNTLSEVNFPAPGGGEPQLGQAGAVLQSTTRMI